MERIDLTKIVDKTNKDECHRWIEWAMIAMVTGVNDVEQDEKGHFWIDIDMKINGKPVEFEPLLRRMFKEYERSVKKEAEEQFMEEYDRKMEDLREASKLFMDRLGVDTDDLCSY